MDQYRSRPKDSENFEGRWSIPFPGEIHMDRSLVHTFSWGNSYGPMVLKVLQKFPPTLVLVHGWPFPALGYSLKRHFSLVSLVWPPSPLYATPLDVAQQHTRPSKILHGGSANLWDQHLRYIRQALLRYSAIHLVWGRKGKGRRRKLFEKFYESSANFPQSFRTLS